MKASITTLVTVLTIGATGLATTSALACHGGYGGYGGGYSSHYSPQYVERVYVSEPVVVSPTFTPAHSLVVIMPGDSWFSICSREYGNPNVWSKVAAFNGMPQNVQFTSGMQLRLPVINPNGSFSLSSAPAAFAMAPQGLTQGGQFAPQGGMPQANSFGPQGQGFAPQQLPLSQPQGTQFGPQGQPLNVPQAPQVDPTNAARVTQLNGSPSIGMPGQPVATNAGPTDRPLPSIVIGSIMAINGQPLGDNRGTVRLIVNGSPVALEIVEWSANAAKVRIPDDLPAGTRGQIEILRADGSVVAKDEVQLAAGPKVAATN